MSILVDSVRRMTFREVEATLRALLAEINHEPPPSCKPGCWAQIDGATWFGMPGEGWAE